MWNELPSLHRYHNQHNFLASFRFFRELPSSRCRKPHPAQESPAAEPRSGARARPALPPVLLPAPGRGTGQPEGPAEGQRPGRDPVMGIKRWPRQSLERGAHHPSSKPQRISGRQPLSVSVFMNPWIKKLTHKLSCNHLYVTFSGVGGVWGVFWTPDKRTYQNRQHPHEQQRWPGAVCT